MGIDKLIFWATTFLYFLATIGYLIQIVTLRKDAEKAATIILLSGFSLHSLYIILRWINLKHPPFINLHEALNFLAWSIVGTYLIMQFKHKPKGLGAFVTPLITIIMVIAATQPQANMLALPPALRSFWLPIHAIICLIGDAVFALAFCIAVMYMVQEHQIKKKKFGAVFKRLPSLTTLDQLNYLCLKIGFPLLTVGIITGSIWAEKAWGSYWSWDPKETWSLITWFLYAALLHQRLTVGWRGRRAAIMTIIGFLALGFTFLGVSLLMPGLHTYYVR